MIRLPSSPQQNLLWWTTLNICETHKTYGLRQCLVMMGDRTGLDCAREQLLALCLEEDVVLQSTTKIFLMIKHSNQYIL